MHFEAGKNCGMLDRYVDDVRQHSTYLRYGARWDAEARIFKLTQDANEEDLRMRREMHDTGNARMVRVCLPAINTINQDLEFTAEVPEEFPENKLPTFDFLLWIELSCILNQSYFQKAMKTPLRTWRSQP